MESRATNGYFQYQKQVVISTACFQYIMRPVISKYHYKTVATSSSAQEMV